MMKNFIVPAIAALGCLFICMNPALAQRVGQEWLTSNADPQRSSWIRTDTKISKESMQKPGFQFLWKMKLDNEAKQLNSLTQPVLLDRLIGYRGFKSLAFVGGSSDTLYAIDDDLGRLYWKTHFNYSASVPQQSGSLPCPGGLTAAATRPTTLLPLAPGRGGGNRVSAARAMVGEPDQGFPDILGRGSAPGSGGNPAPVAPTPAGPPAPAPAAAGAVGQGSVNSVYALASDGMLHQLSVQTGKDVVMLPVQFVPPNAHASTLILVDNMLYTSTTNVCGGVPNGVWAIDLSSPEKTITNWNANGANIAGSAGPAIGTGGTVYVATADSAGSSSVYANSIVALEPKTLKVKDYFTQPKADFSASPIVFQHNGKDLIVAAGKDGRMYILNSTSLGGTDHHTPLSVTPQTTNSGDFGPSALASWQDAEGTRWLIAPTGSAIAAFKVVEQNGTPALQQGWMSRELISPLSPIVINDVVFALSSGEYRSGGTQMTPAQRAQRSKPAILYALDALTGQELWNSGTTITSFVHSGGLSGGLGQVYVGTYDSTFYAFGFPIEK
jgi:outer membrane protein assembly factor BamB